MRHLCCCGKAFPKDHKLLVKAAYFGLGSKVMPYIYL